MNTDFGIEELSWQDSALCAQTDPDMFYPETTGEALHSRRVCIQCPVRQACLDKAIADKETYGVWGGTTRDDRYAIRRGEKFDIYSKLGKTWMKKNGIEKPVEDEN
jgi:WhiB family transcriptional regulator, redox-sensing transcriptional regulator